jgi:predicted RNA binding protein YcfA (HicA-like mRNA interferase family)
MTKLKRVTAAEMVRALRRAGFLEDRQEGSHVTLYSITAGRRVTVLMHTGDMSVRLTHKILKQAGLTADDLRCLLG